MTSINILKSFITSIIILFLNSSNHNYGATAFNSYRSKLQADEQISKSVPPKVHHTAKNYDSSYNREEIFKRVNQWSANDKENVWELSGLFEGDIMPNSDSKIRNGLVDETMRWPNGSIPIYIKRDDFDEEDIDQIVDAIDEFHEKTCLVFRPYDNKTDKNYVTFQGNEPGCWSSVGKQNKGQVINLQNPGCLKHGTIVHEILHAVGFYHQQSTYNRDEYIQVKWENIQPGKEHNFNKYDNNTVTDFNTEYDYNSVMHYSSKAFSRNGNETIIPLKPGIEIGQRKGMSKKDLFKVRKMYNDECKGRKPAGVIATVPLRINNLLF
ncbi:seminal metalloprotease 1 [Microplitis demolitor]|uniref:seminal metalloprotease 1 n=1 Tax=Microplitis demolitor TaxID=69319 RepID=UPI0004CDA505|nr:seminal metalloprotease 1 [Microplitis demolitor]